MATLSITCIAPSISSGNGKTLVGARTEPRPDLGPDGLLLVDVVLFSDSTTVSVPADLDISADKLLVISALCFSLVSNSLCLY